MSSPSGSVIELTPRLSSSKTLKLALLIALLVIAIILILVSIVRNEQKVVQLDKEQSLMLRRICQALEDLGQQKVLETDEIGIILTDQYPGINSREFKQYLQENNIKLIFTAVNTPFSNGLNERLNQTIVNKIRCKINEKNNKRTWTTVARECIQKYNETEHSVTGFAPKYLLDGTNVSILPNEIKMIEKEDKWIADRRLALENTIKSHKYNKKIFDRNRKMQELEIGDSVYVENGNRLNRKKLDELKIGPFKIVEKISKSIYRIDTGGRKTESTLFHITKLQPVTTEAEVHEVEENEYEDNL